VQGVTAQQAIQVLAQMVAIPYFQVLLRLAVVVVAPKVELLLVKQEVLAVVVAHNLHPVVLEPRAKVMLEAHLVEALTIQVAAVVLVK